MAAPLLMMVALVRVAALAVSFEPGAMTVSVPVRGGTAAAPEVRVQPGEITVEVPEGRVERQSTTLMPPAGRVAEIAEVSAQTSRSHHRAVVTLRLREGVVLPRERVEAVLQEGVLKLVVRDGSQAAAPVQPAAQPAPVQPAAQPAAARAETKGPVPLEHQTLGAPTQKVSEQWPRLAAALCLLGLAAWLGVVYLRKRNQGPRDTRASAIDIVATRMVGGKQRLLVVDVEQQRFLLSASDSGGVQLLSPIGEGTERSPVEVPRAAAVAARADDPLENVFSDMLDNVHRNPSPAPRSIEARAAELRPEPLQHQQQQHQPQAARPAQPARPALQLADEPSPMPKEQEPDQEPELRQVKQAAAPRQRSTLLDLKASGADVSGLLALRRNRTGAGPC